MPWTYHEFVALLQARDKALTRRDTVLVWWFGGLLGLGVLSAVVLSTISRSLAIAGVVAAFAGLAVLVIYILASTRGYARKHRVACPTCGVSLLEVAEELDIIAEDSAPLPEVVQCPGCGVALIADTA